MTDELRELLESIAKAGSGSTRAEVREVAGRLDESVLRLAAGRGLIRISPGLPETGAPSRAAPPEELRLTRRGAAAIGLDPDDFP